MRSYTCMICEDGYPARIDFSQGEGTEGKGHSKGKQKLADAWPGRWEAERLVAMVSASIVWARLVCAIVCPLFLTTQVGCSKL